MSDIELHLLGPVRVWRDGVELTLGSARRTAVLCVLALRAGRAVSRDELVAAVWGDDPPASATGNVYTYVSALRQLLEPDRDRWAAGHLLTSTAGTYQLNVPRDSIDAFRFEADLEAARRHRSAGNTAAELTALDSALRRWHGDPLTAIPGPHADTHRLRLTELHLTAAHRHTILLTEPNRPADTTASPIGVAGASGGTGSRPARASVGASRPQRLVGRDSDLRRLRRAVAEAARGRGSSLRIEGAPGEGKTALLTAALRGTALHGMAPDGYRIGWATADELSQRVPGGVLLECIETALGAEATPLTKLLTELPSQPLAAPVQGDGSDLDRVVEGIGRAAGKAPLILVVDDLQWADPVSLRVWGALGARVEGLPVLLVAAALAGSGAVRELAADEVIALGPLESEAATALVRASAEVPPEDEVLGRILDDAGGNPYYLRHLAAASDGGRRDGAVAGTVVAAVGAHLASLPEASRQVLRTVAFLGAYDLEVAGTLPGCTPAGLGAVYDGDAGELARVLDPALRAGILTTEGERLVFRHRVVARVLHEGTPAAVRVTVHRSFADRIAAAGGPPEQVAGQLLAGEVPFDRALADWLVGHVEALAERAPGIALSALRRARAQQAADPAQRLVLTAWLARLLLRGDSAAEVEASWVAARTTDPELEGEMRWVAATSHERRGDFQAASDVAWAAVRERRIPPRWMERLRAVIGRARPHLAGEETQPYSARTTTSAVEAVSGRETVSGGDAVPAGDGVVEAAGTS
jgi:hypothetical protein